MSRSPANAAIRQRCTASVVNTTNATDFRRYPLDTLRMMILRHRHYMLLLLVYCHADFRYAAFDA